MKNKINFYAIPFVYYQSTGPSFAEGTQLSIRIVREIIKLDINY